MRLYGTMLVCSELVSDEFISILLDTETNEWQPICFHVGMVQSVRLAYDDLDTPVDACVITTPHFEAIIDVPINVMIGLIKVMHDDK